MKRNPILPCSIRPLLLAFLLLFLSPSEISPLLPEDLQSALQKEVSLEYKEERVGYILDNISAQIGGKVSLSTEVFEGVAGEKITLVYGEKVPAHQALSALTSLFGLKWEATQEASKDKKSLIPAIYVWKGKEAQVSSQILKKEYVLKSEGPTPLLDVVIRLADEVGIGVAFAPGAYNALKGSYVTLAIPSTPLDQLLRLLEIRAGIQVDLLPVGETYFLYIARP